MVVVQAFRLAADPEDRLAAEDLARSPLASMVGLPVSEGHERVADAERRIAGRRLRARFGEEGPAAVVDGWRRELADRLTPRESARLRQMVEQLEADMSGTELNGRMLAETEEDMDPLIALSAKPSDVDPESGGIAYQRPKPPQRPRPSKKHVESMRGTKSSTLNGQGQLK